MSDRYKSGSPAKSSGRPNTGEYSRTDIASMAVIFDRLNKVEERLASVERSGEMIMTGQGRLSEQFIEQRISLGKIEATLGYLRDEMTRHDKAISHVEHHTHRIEVESAERTGRRGALFGIIKQVWSGKQYWLLPLLAALAGYISTKF